MLHAFQDVAAYLDAHDLLAARATCKAWRLGLGSCISSLQLPVLPQQGVQQPALAAAVRSALAALPRLGSVSITLLPSTPPEAVEEVLCAVDGARHIAIEEAHLLDGVPDRFVGAGLWQCVHTPATSRCPAPSPRPSPACLPAAGPTAGRTRPSTRRAC
jgi:hypothetical protein